MGFSEERRVKILLKHNFSVKSSDDHLQRKVAGGQPFFLQKKTYYWREKRHTHPMPSVISLYLRYYKSTEPAQSVLATK